jgi:hypothetical protein
MSDRQIRPVVRVRVFIADDSNHSGKGDADARLQKFFVVVGVVTGRIFGRMH